MSYADTEALYTSVIVKVIIIIIIIVIIVIRLYFFKFATSEALAAGHVVRMAEKECLSRDLKVHGESLSLTISGKVFQLCGV